MSLAQWQFVLRCKPHRTVSLCQGSGARILAPGTRRLPFRSHRQNHLHEFGAPGYSLGRPLQLCHFQGRHQALHGKHRAGTAPHKIRVNAIGPGAIKTPINRTAWETPAAEAALLTLIPYDRVGLPEDIAKAAVWLASDESDYVTGTTLFVDGGMTLYPGFATGG